MARDSRSPRTATPSARPGGRPGNVLRLRASGDAHQPKPEPETEEAPAESPAPRPLTLRIRGLTVTRRAVALVAVFVVLALSYATTLRVYIDQQHDIAVSQQNIRDQTAQVASLESQIARWDDPAYVKAQARERLGWVMPGETGYRVIGEDGTPMGGGAVIESQKSLPPGEYPTMWWNRLWGSVQTADAPTPKAAAK